MTEGGTYTLVVELAVPREVRVGSLGRLALDPGAYAYTGSALGSGGFRRVERHRAVASGENPARHWHVDHLLGLDGSAAAAVVRSPGEAVECEVARTIAAGDRVPGFGASDCGCESHLTHAPRPTPLLRAVVEAHRRATGREPGVESGG